MRFARSAARLAGIEAEVLRDGALIVLSILGLLWMCLRWYHPAKVIAFIDLFPVYNPVVLPENVAGLGHAGSPFGMFDFPTFSTYYFLHYVLSAFTNTGLAEVLVFWLFITTAWLGAFVLLRSLGIRFFGAFLGAWTFACNPYSQFVVGLVTGSAMAALLPWMFWIVHRGAVDKRSRAGMTLLAALLSLTVLPWVGSTPQLFFEFVLLLAAWCAFWLPRSDGAFLKWIGVTVLSSVIASSWWLLPVAAALVDNKVGHTTQVAAMAWTFAHSSLLNNLRFINPWTWGVPAYIPYSSGYDANVFTYASGFFAIAMLCVALLIRRTSYAPLVRFGAVVTVVAMFIAKGMHAPLEGLNARLYHIPGFILLIEPVGLTIGALLCLSIVVGIVANELPQRQLGRHAQRWRAQFCLAL